MTTAPRPIGNAEGARRRDDLVIGRGPLTIEDVAAVAAGERSVALETSPAFRAAIAAARAVVERGLGGSSAMYGVTTGVGASVTNDIPPGLRSAMPENLFRFHGCGTGAILDEEAAAAAMLVRLVSLARGHSGVRIELLERMVDLLNLRMLPRIPSEGSVGASGDLTPLSYLAAVLAGEREVTLRGEPMDAAAAHALCRLQPLALQPKESLALMNGTAVMTALSCLAYARASRLARLATAITAIMVDVTHGNPEHFDEQLLAMKPHPGQTRCGAWIRVDLARGPGNAPARRARLQDRYSLRCAPHVIGTLLDGLAFGREVLEIELNGVDDNPIITAGGAVLHGGNFYGGHVCMVADLLKAQVAGIADLLDRQLALVCAPETSDGLPANLVAADEVVHHGFKAMQISASALTAEALKLTMPASAFSRSTESHNQDKVSMGTIAARDLVRVLELTETVAAIVLLAGLQAVDLRGPSDCGCRAVELHDSVRIVIPMVIDDRRQDRDIDYILDLLRRGELPIGAPS
jgi:histidine ammonia-lyase